MASKQLTESGEQRAIEDAAERGARRVFEGSRTPAVGSPRSSDSSAEMYAIAERVVDREEAGHMRRCEAEGPAKRLREELIEVKADVKSHTQILSEIAGAQKLSRWLVPIVVSVLSSSMAVAAVKMMVGR